MKTSLAAAALTAVVTSTLPQAHAMGDYDPEVLKVTGDQLEYRFHDDEKTQVFEGDITYGNSFDKFRLKADVERHRGETEELNLQALWLHAISPYWDLQLGLSRDIHPDPVRNHLVIGFDGLAPFFFETDASLLIDKDGRTSLSVTAEQELMLSQKLVLSPEFSVKAHSTTSDTYGEGKGLANIGVGLRLKYEIVREFAPYVGAVWSRGFGDSADIIDEDGGDIQSTQWAAGVSFWF